MHPNFNIASKSLAMTKAERIINAFSVKAKMLKFEVTHTTECLYCAGDKLLTVLPWSNINLLFLQYNDIECCPERHFIYLPKSFIALLMLTEKYFIYCVIKTGPWCGSHGSNGPAQSCIRYAEEVDSGNSCWIHSWWGKIGCWHVSPFVAWLI